MLQLSQEGTSAEGLSGKKRWKGESRAEGTEMGEEGKPGSRRKYRPE